jgi:ribonuclease D
MTISIHEDDLPHELDLGNCVAIDTETMGLQPNRDRLCLMQLSAGDGNAHIVRFTKGQYKAPNLKAMIGDPAVTKLFHFGRFDIAVIQQYLEVTAAPVYCTKIASKLARTYTDRHGLKDLCRELLDISISKEQQSSDWGSDSLSEAQLNYAAADVLYLHQLRDKLNDILAREGRAELASACFKFLADRVKLDLAGWPEIDIFSH